MQQNQIKIRTEYRARRPHNWQTAVGNKAPTRSSMPQWNAWRVMAAEKGIEMQQGWRSTNKKKSGVRVICMETKTSFVIPSRHIYEPWEAYDQFHRDQTDYQEAIRAWDEKLKTQETARQELVEKTLREHNFSAYNWRHNYQNISTMSMDSEQVLEMLLALGLIQSLPHEELLGLKPQPPRRT